MQKPFQAPDIDLLKEKVIKEKMSAPLPHTVSKELLDLITKMLKKNPANRPTITEIIESASFRAKAKLLKIAVPTNK